MGLKDEIEDIEEFSPEEYEEYLRELNDKKHKELISTMQSLIAVLKPIKNDNALQKALKDNADVMQSIAKKMTDFKLPVQKNEVVVKSDEAAIKHVNFIAKELAKTLADLKTTITQKKPKNEWEFSVKRDFQTGQIISILAKEK